MGIIGICGEPRSGKTLLMTILLLRDYQKGKKILTNYHTEFSEMINPIDLLDFKLTKVNIGLDELHTIIDSRSNSNTNRFFSYFSTQSGKRDIKIYYTAQILGSVDLRIRLLSSRIILAEDKGNRFKYSVVNRNGVVIRRFYMSKKKASQYYDLYNTEEIITPVELGGGNLDLVSVTNIYDNAPTKKAFVTSLRKDYPFIGYDIAQSVYDYFENDNVSEVKKLLSITA